MPIDYFGKEVEKAQKELARCEGELRETEQELNALLKRGRIIGLSQGEQKNLDGLTTRRARWRRKSDGAAAGLVVKERAAQRCGGIDRDTRREVEALGGQLKQLAVVLEQFDLLDAENLSVPQSWHGKILLTHGPTAHEAFTEFHAVLEQYAELTGRGGLSIRSLLGEPDIAALLEWAKARVEAAVKARPKEVQAA